MININDSNEPTFRGSRRSEKDTCKGFEYQFSYNVEGDCCSIVDIALQDLVSREYIMVDLHEIKVVESQMEIRVRIYVIPIVDYLNKIKEIERGAKYTGRW
jgi:hypothetical protein